MRSARPNQPKRRSTRLALLRLAARAAPASAAKATRSPQRVLLLRPDHIGDVLLTAHAVALLRSSLPGAQLTYLVGPWSAEAARHGPAVDTVQTLAYPGFTRRANPNVLQPYALLLSEAARLRRQRFDLAVVFRPDHWWGALLALIAGVPVRVGGATPETAPLLTHTYAAGCSEHAAERALGMARLALEAVGVTPVTPDAVQTFALTDAARAEADAFWRLHGLSKKRVLAIQPNAGAPLKSWPLENWSRLADALLARDFDVLLVGAPDDRPLLSRIVERMARQGAVIACGQSLSTSVALYERCELAITVDSGAGHLAAAVGTPTVRLYGPASPEIFGPWPPRATDHVLMTNRLTCVPCGHLESPPCGAHVQPACMLALSVEDVLNTVSAQLSRS